jgi:hypothetical protein
MIVRLELMFWDKWRGKYLGDDVPRRIPHFKVLELNVDIQSNSCEGGFLSKVSWGMINILCSRGFVHRCFVLWNFSLVLVTFRCRRWVLLVRSSVQCWIQFCL